MITLLAPQKGERILDLGCGTGHMTQQIAAAGAEVVGIDSAATMIEQARKNYPDLHFEVADARDFYFPEPFDVVFSNAVLHWVKEPERVIACIWKALKPGGRFVAEFGGKGNIQSIVEAIYKAFAAIGYSPKPDLLPWYFPSIGEYTTLLEKQGFCVTYAALFDRPTPLDDGEKGLHHWFEMFGNGFLGELSSNQRREVITKIEDLLRPRLYREGIWVTDYRRIRVVAIK